MLVGLVFCRFYVVLVSDVLGLFQVVLNCCSLFSFVQVVLSS